MSIPDMLVGAAAGFLFVLLLSIGRNAFKDWLDYHIRCKTSKSINELYDMCYALQREVRELKVAQEKLDECAEVKDGDELSGKGGAR